MDEEKDLEPQVGKDRGPVVVGVAAVAAIALVAGGVCGYRAYEDHRVSVARGACQSAVADLSKAVKAYRDLLSADATVAAAKTDAKSVGDAKTVDALKRAVGTKAPAMVGCDASDADGLDRAAARAGRSVKAAKADAKTLESAVRAVEASKLDKTVADADALYKATEGKVQDEKTRETLKQAIARRDAGAIAKAVKAVGDSKAAKEKADAEAKEKAEREAVETVDNPNASGGSGYSSGPYSGGTASDRPYRSAGNGGGWSYSGGVSGGSVSSGDGGGAPAGGGGSSSSTGGSGSTGETSGIPSTSGCTASITGECSTAPGGEAWW